MSYLDIATGWKFTADDRPELDTSHSFYRSVKKCMEKAIDFALQHNAEVTICYVTVDDDYPSSDVDYYPALKKMIDEGAMWSAAGGVNPDGSVWWLPREKEEANKIYAEIVGREEAKS